jgi:hypothetical protein
MQNQYPHRKIGLILGLVLLGPFDRYYLLKG